MDQKKIFRIVYHFLNGIFAVLGMLTVYVMCGNGSYSLLLHDIRYGLSGHIRLIVVLIIVVFFFLIPIFYTLADNGIVLSLSIRIEEKKHCIKTKYRHTKAFDLLERVIGIVGLVGSIICLLIINNRLPKPSWEGDSFIAHAGGMIDGQYYTNCAEAIERNYERGFRSFEIDFVLTSDDQLVCRHDWDYQTQLDIESGFIPDMETFMNSPVFEIYTPMSAGSLMDIMEKYPDIYIVTDTKYTDEDNIKKEFENLLSQAKGREHILDRFVIQIYNGEMYDTVRSIYPFNNWIYTLYQIWTGADDEFEQYARFCCEHNIKAITCWNFFANPTIVDKAKEYGVDVYVHTENKVDQATELHNIGVKGFYTDTLEPNEF